MSWLFFADSQEHGREIFRLLFTGALGLAGAVALLALVLGLLLWFFYLRPKRKER